MVIAAVYLFWLRDYKSQPDPMLFVYKKNRNIVMLHIKIFDCCFLFHPVLSLLKKIIINHNKHALLHSLYTCRAIEVNTHLIKSSNDTTLLGLLGMSEEGYRSKTLL